MGTVFSFDIREPGVPAEVLEQAIALLHHIDETFSPYLPASAISRLAAGDLALSQAPQEVREVLAECDVWQHRTHGWFSARAGGRLDPSGYVKGWAIRSVSELLEHAGSTSHCVNGGGDVQCVGTSTGGEPWRVGVADPRDPSRLLTVVTGADLAVATSGSAERGAHILDPNTQRPPADPLLSLTVTGRSVLECDVYATAGFAMGEPARAWFGDRPEVRAFALKADGTTWSTFPVGA